MVDSKTFPCSYISEAFLRSFSMSKREDFEQILACVILFVQRFIHLNEEIIRALSDETIEVKSLHELTGSYVKLLRKNLVHVVSN